MDGWMYVRMMDVRTYDGCTYVWMDVHTYVWMDGCTYVSMHVRTNGWM